MRSRFPHPSQADETGLLCIGGDLSVETLLDAYTHGIFPWPQSDATTDGREDMPMLWFSPLKRGVLDFDRIHVPRSLHKWITREGRRSDRLKTTENKAFERVIAECAAKPRRGQSGTWILPEMKVAYTELFKKGHALSFEVWRESNLVAGIYGVKTKNYISAESMFGHESNIAKFCLLEWTRTLQQQGYKWLDIQMVTPVTSQLGGHLISRESFLKRINAKAPSEF